MSDPQPVLEFLRARVEGRNEWMLTGEGALPGVRATRISSTTLESLPVNRREVAVHVERVMAALERYGSRRVATPGGAGWLYVQHVPVRRLVTQLVLKLLALGSWEPFMRSPGPLKPLVHQELIGLRESSAQEYQSFTVTWSGVAYVLGAEAAHNPLLPENSPTPPRRSSKSAQVAAHLRSAGVVAVSWSSRHWRTLLPVLQVLGRDGHRCVLVDLASDPAEQCPGPLPWGVTVVTAPAALFAGPSTPAIRNAPFGQGSSTVAVGMHTLHLSRVEQLALALVDRAGGCTQPSWDAVVHIERWLDGILHAVRPHTVVVSNDTSPLGALAVHIAQHHAMNTVYVQHGAWSAERVSWPALHSRHIVVMGDRDADLAAGWARHPRAEVHVLGQPRFDTLGQLDRDAQRRYLHRLISTQGIVVWACQPFSQERLAAHAELLLEGLRRTPGSWGLVVAPHPAQNADAFRHLLCKGGSPQVAVADPRLGARGCLAGADALASAYSTCGIEAALLEVPVLEIGAPAENTLGLASYGLAHRCTTPDQVSAALTAPVPPPGPATDSVCRWRGTSAYDIAQLILAQAPAHYYAPGKGAVLR
ncbi:hypothetical protein [Streptomyces acidiscabies]|uniref:hypothetical protein n=1 Tax=Streptomyces acidiscabies TaxID=42234 RepID=UPI0038F719E7